jgi:hypothetical protein
MEEHQKKETEQFTALREEITNRIGVLEKWRYLIIGGSIVVGFALTEIIHLL